jgi:hypothetical protein
MVWAGAGMDVCVGGPVGGSLSDWVAVGVSSLGLATGVAATDGWSIGGAGTEPAGKISRFCPTWMVVESAGMPFKMRMWSTVTP